MSKSKTTNTAKDEVNPSWLLGGNPNAIENQEAQGQQDLIASDQLPKKCNTPNDGNAAAVYSKMGIKVFTTSKGDDLFIGVKLPAGWKKQATDHSMWNNLVDDKGRIRATFFYKAAFYDRNAFINFTTCFHIHTEHLKGEKNPEKDWDCAEIITVINRNTGTAVWTSQKGFHADNEKHVKQAKEYLNENFPDWQDIHAYWD